MKNTYFNNEQYLTSERPFNGGCAMRFTFPNGYTGSVVKHFGSYGGPQGLWEIAVVHNDRLVYDTPVTNDVLGWQTDEDVEQVLNQIRELPERVA